MIVEMAGNGFLHSHSLPFPCNRFPFLPIPIPEHYIDAAYYYFGAREDSSLNMPLKLTISYVYFYSTETRKIVLENIKSFDL